MGTVDFVDTVIHMCIICMLAKLFIIGYMATMVLPIMWWGWHQLLKWEKGLR